jgi:hypothetical protein
MNRWTLLKISLVAVAILSISVTVTREPSSTIEDLTSRSLRSWAEQLVRDTLEDALDIQASTDYSWVRSLAEAAHDRPGGSRYLDVIEGNLLFENYRLEPHVCLMGWIAELENVVITDCEVAEYPRMYPDDDYLLGPV